MEKCGSQSHLSVDFSEDSDECFIKHLSDSQSLIHYLLLFQLSQLHMYISQSV